MKKKIVFLLTLLLTLTLAGAALANTEDQMKDMVQTYLDENGQDYVYDDYVFTLKLAIGSALEYADVRIFIYDDMLSVIADAPVQVSEENFEKMAVFTTLANNEIFYGQFRVDREYGYVSCRSCNLVEDVIPGENELYYLINEPMRYMEEYGDGIHAVIGGGDPYEAFEACQAAVNE